MAYYDETLESDAREDMSYNDRIAQGLTQCDCGEWFYEDYLGECRDNDLGIPMCVECRLEREQMIGGGDVK